MVEWKERLKLERENKDEFLKRHFQSPIPPEDREDFEGLDYFPLDPDYRFGLELHEHDKKEEIEVEDTKGGTQKYICWGEFRFPMDGKKRALQAYKADPDEEEIWVPFKDETCGEESYGAGRYLDLELEDRNEDGKWILDFNQAYNPFCAFSEDYVCPFIPTENWLEVPVRAGEKDYKED